MDDPQKTFLAAYDLYADAIYRHCAFRVFSRTRAEELMQETFMRAWQYLSDGKEVENMRAFLYRIANNLVIDESRKKKEMSLDALLETADFLEPSNNERVMIEHRMLLKDVMADMRQLSEEAQQLLMMRYIDDLGPKEIAEVLDIDANNVSVKLNRAIKALRDIVGNK